MSGGFGITGAISGVNEAAASLRQLNVRVQRRIVRKCLTKATKPTLMAAKANARKTKDSGLLSRSVARKTATYQGGRGWWSILAVIGPKRGMRRPVKRKGRRTPVVADPVNYAHLVEYGTAPHSLDRGATAPKLKASVDKRRAQTAQSIAKREAKISELRSELQATASNAKRDKLTRTIGRQEDLLRKAYERQIKLRNAAVRGDNFRPTGRRVHPGMPARPFLRPAFDSTKARVADIFAASAREMQSELVKKG